MAGGTGFLLPIFLFSAWMPLNSGYFSALVPTSNHEEMAAGGLT
jgi:hypothetical protein